jgi:hypothetical protein
MPKEIEVRVRIISTKLGGYDPGLARYINGSHNSEHYTGLGHGSASGSVSGQRIRFRAILVREYR